MKMLLKGRWLLIAALVSLAGCATTGDELATGEAPVEERPVAGGGVEGGEGGVTASGAEMANRFEGRAIAEVLSDSDSPIAKRVFYFPFDSSDISAEDRDAIAAHAEFLLIHPELSVVIEGHADERGSREYNLALGERRAQAVERMLTLQGVAMGQLQVISFGEERPVALDHDEQAWSLNRRVEIIYSGY